MMLAIADGEDSLLTDDPGVVVDLDPPSPADRQSPVADPRIT